MEAILRSAFEKTVLPEEPVLRTKKTREMSWRDGSGQCVALTRPGSGLPGQSQVSLH